MTEWMVTEEQKGRKAKGQDKNDEVTIFTKMEL